MVILKPRYTASYDTMPDQHESERKEPIMRRAALHDHVTYLVEEHFEDDVAKAVINCEAFGALAHRLNEAGDGDPDQIALYVADLADHLTDSDADFIVGDTESGEAADAPAAVLSRKIDDL